MNQQDRKYLRDRLADARRKAISRSYTTPKKPDAVRKAEAISRKWHAANNRRRSRIQDAIGATALDVAALFITGDSEKVLAGIRAFEKRKFQ